MVEELNKLYFTHEEFKKILEHYGRAIRDKNKLYKEKIPYDSYRNLYANCVKGVKVIEDKYGDLWFYDEDETKFNKEYWYLNEIGTEERRFVQSTSLVMIITPDHDFYKFFYNNYFQLHSDYRSLIKNKEEDKDVAIINSNTTDWTIKCIPEKEVESCRSTDNHLTWYNNSSTHSKWLTDYSQDGKTTTSPTYSWNNNSTWTTTLDNVNISDALKQLTETAQSAVGSIKSMEKEFNKNEKESKTMKGFNFDFGACTYDNVRMSMYGIAVKNQAGEWVSYNPATAQIVNVDIFNFEGGKFMFKMPVAPAKVVKGDVIIHNKKAMIVLDIDENGFVVVDPHAGEEKKVVPTSNCFGFNFITKIVSMFDMSAAAPNADSPFGNMLPLMLMADDQEIDPMMMMFMMNQNGDMGDMFGNPMMMYFLMQNSSKDAILPLMMMMGQTQAPKSKSGK